MQYLDSCQGKLAIRSKNVSVITAGIALRGLISVATYNYASAAPPTQSKGNNQPVYYSVMGNERYMGVDYQGVLEHLSET